VNDYVVLCLGQYVNQFGAYHFFFSNLGETFIFFNKQIKGNKREIIQLGVPLFQPTTEEANCMFRGLILGFLLLA
jgi:hypothetical protein